MRINFAERQHIHNYRIDPIVRSMLDTDFYKFLMAQLVHEMHPMTNVTFKLTNRTTDVRLAEIIDEGELREQLDHVRTLRFKRSELVWLQGQTFYGKTGIFKPAFIEALRTLRLPDYRLSVDRESGQFELSFTGPWFQVMWWEIPALAIVNELRNRALMKDMSYSDLDILYARAKVRLHDKLLRLAQVPDLNLSDFGTRRRHGFLWQEHCLLTACEILGDRFTGTSNALLAKEHDLEAKGTNAHELPMVYAALAQDDEALKQSQYRVVHDWNHFYDDALRIILPDTFGTTQFLRDAPFELSFSTGARPDSKKPIAAGEELIDWWGRIGKDPTKMLIIFSDGLDVALPGAPANGEDIVAIQDHFRGRCRIGFGWGTNLTNDFVGCANGDPKLMKPISLVCKVASANGRSAVKLSDNYTKATGSDPKEIARYRRVFGSDGMANAPALV